MQESYPLSPIQQGMLFHSVYAPQGGVDILQMVYVLREPLEREPLEYAWRHVISRHSVLRTRFRWEGLAEPRQEVFHEVDFSVTHLDWRGIWENKQQERLELFLQKDREQGFDLTCPPLMRATLVQMHDRDFRLVWTMHHAVIDGRSVVILTRELFTAYEAYRGGEAPRLPAPRPFRDHVEWLQKQDFGKAEHYWRARLEGFTGATLFGAQFHPGERVFGKQQGIGHQERQLSESSTGSLRCLAKEHGLSVNTLVQGVWAMVLGCYSGEEDVVFGATRTLRHSSFPASDSIVGPLINTLPVRVRIRGDKPLLPWLKELRAQWITGRDFEHTPLWQIQQWSAGASGLPLFASLLVFENYDLSTIMQMHGWSSQGRELRVVGQPNYPLTLGGWLGAKLRLTLAYDRGCLTDETANRILVHLQTLLEAVAENPHRRLFALPLLTESEKHQLVVEWNDTRRDYPTSRCLQQLFERQADKTPEAPAVVFEGQRVTYRELNHRANQLAHHLKKRGVGAETLVAICMKRSLEMIVGVLGVLKAGGAYVALYSKAPREALAFMLKDSGAKLLLTQRRLMDSHRLPESVTDFSEARNGGTETPALCLDSNWEVINREPVANPIFEATVQNLAYVIYTSGSTGKPKGVLIEHGQILNYVQAIQEICGFTGGGSYAMVQPLSVDSSQTVIFPPLITGGVLHVISEDTAADPQALATYFSQSPIDFLKIAPAHLAALREACSQPERLLPRRCLIIGGEPSRTAWVDQLREKAPCTIFNHYGPTEATVGTLTFEVKEDAGASGSSTVPIGRPLPNTEAYVLNRHLQPVPLGIPGELYLGGRCLARGYLNRPDLTAENFIAHAFAGGTGQRLYKTGDLVRYRSDGNLEFMGRTDQQLKIRGFRVEPAEIESVLTSHPALQQCVVATRKEHFEGKRLVAYVVPQQGHNVSASELRRFLKQKLPDYMVPGSFIFLGALPLTSHGKVNLSALPAPEQNWEHPEDFYPEPTTPVQATLAEIWSEVLELKRIHIRDNFFELGGHSLSAMRVISRIRDKLQMNVPLRLMFERPTLGELANGIEEIFTAMRSGGEPDCLLDEINSQSEKAFAELATREPSSTNRK